MDRPRYAPTHNWPPTTGPLAGSLSELGDRVNGLPEWLHGKYLDVPIATGGAAAVYYPHGLGRAWRGAWILGQSFTADARVALPDATRPYEVVVAILAGATGTLRLWVF